MPDKLHAKGKPEVQLATIDLETSNLADVIRAFGTPTRKLEVPNNPYWTGYEWDMPHGKLEIGVSHGIGKSSESPDSRIEDIYIEGSKQTRANSTGSGLKLGDSLADLQRIYGKLYQLSAANNAPSTARQSFVGVQDNNEHLVATIQWQRQEFTLRVGFDIKGKIDAMWLILPECYPDGCD